MTSSSTPIIRTPPVVRWRVLLHAVAFVLGFSLVFILGWGGAATILGQVFSGYKLIIARIGGVVVILFGLATLGLLKIPWLYYDTRPQWNRVAGRGLVPSGLMGVFFAAGWTPCIGTTLGAILTLGFSQGTSGQAMLLSSGYALGLGIPFIALGFVVDHVGGFVRRFQRKMRWLQIASGIFLLVIGIMLLTNQLSLIAIWAQRNGLFLDLPLGSTASPTYIIAILAGLLSFLSPCVLPLVPAYLGYLSGQVLVGKGEEAT